MLRVLNDSNSCPSATFIFVDRSRYTGVSPDEKCQVMRRSQRITRTSDSIHFTLLLSTTRRFKCSRRMNTKPKQKQNAVATLLLRRRRWLTAFALRKYLIISRVVVITVRSESCHSPTMRSCANPKKKKQSRSASPLNDCAAQRFSLEMSNFYNDPPLQTTKKWNNRGGGCKINQLATGQRPAFGHRRPLMNHVTVF